ncbi:MAG: folate-binding protein [Sphingomonas sp.]
MDATTLTSRALIRLSGEDVRGFLQGLVTNDVAGALPVWAALLSAQGKALYDFIVWADPAGGDDLLIDCEESQADALARRLTLYRLRRAITIARDGALAVHWAAAGGAGVADPRLAALGRRWLAPAGVGATGWDAHRLALGVTEGVAELGQDRTLWLECNAAELDGVSFTKGCYVGQENTARMNWRQKVNRRLGVVRAETDPGEAARIWYPALGLAVVHRRIDALADEPALVRPDWLAAALAVAPPEA